MVKEKFGWKKVKFVVFILLAFLFLFPTGAGLAATDLVCAVDEGMTSVLKKTDVEVENNAIVSTNDTLSMHYDFSITGANYKAIKDSVAAKKETVYELSIPKYLKPKGSGIKIPVNAKVEGNSYQFASLSYSSAGASLVFEGDFWDQGYAGLLDAYIEFECALDAEVIGIDEGVEIEFLGGNTVYLKVKENQKTEHGLKKSGHYDESTGLFTWVLTYTPGTIGVEYPLSLKDNLGEGHLLKADSVAYADDSAETASPLPTATTENILTFGPINEAEVNDAVAASKSFSYTYQTVLSDEGVADSTSDTTVTNTAALYAKDGTQIGDAVSASATATKGSKAFLKKTGRQSPTNSRLIDWTITLNTNNRNLRDLVLYDDYPAELGAPLNMKINGEEISTFGVTLDSSGGTFDDTPYRFTVSFPNSPIPTGVYTISYSTPVEDSYFEGPQTAATFNNDVWLSFDWMKYGGTEPYLENYVLPTVTKPVGIATNVLQKNGSYNRANHTITWKIILNPHKVNIVSGTITDPLDGVAEKATTYANNLSILPNDGKIKVHQDSHGKLLKLEVGDIGTETYTIQFSSTVDDPAHFAYNNATTDKNHPNGISYLNTASFEGEVLTSSSPSTKQTINNKITASVWVVSKVFEKAAGKYDPATRQIEWTFTVNENEMPMTDAVIEDILPAGLSYVSHNQVSGKGNPEVKATGQKVEVKYGNIDDKQVLKLVTAVDPDKIDGFKCEDSIEIGNTATLSRGGEYKAPIQASASTTVANQVLNKTGNLQSSKDAIDYAININPNRLTLPAGLKVKDTLPEGLKLSAGSVKLYEATVKEDGSLNKSGEAIACALDILPSDNSFTITLPAGSMAYILEYTCLVFESNGNFQNNIEFLGGGFSGAASSSACEVAVAGGGGGTALLCGEISVTALEKDSPDVCLCGTVYRIVADYGNGFIVVGEETADDLGEMTFSGLDFDVPHKLEVVSLPDGYGEGSVDGTNLEAYTFTLTSNQRALSITADHALLSPATETDETNKGESGDDESGHEEDAPKDITSPATDNVENISQDTNTESVGPATGDSSMVLWFFALTLLSAVVVVRCVIKIRKSSL